MLPNNNMKMYYCSTDMVQISPNHNIILTKQYYEDIVF